MLKKSNDAASDILDQCTQMLGQEKADVAGCVARFPAFRRELERLLPLINVLWRGREVKPSATFSQDSPRRLEARLAQRPRRRASSFWASLFVPMRLQTRRLNMAWGLVIALVVSLAAGGGTIYAADQAAPGDALYSLDRLAERVQVNLTQDPAQAIQLQLDLATERIQEMQKLAARGDTELVGDTLADYGAAVETALNKWQSAPDQAALGEAIELQLKLQDQELAKVGDDVDPDDTTEPEAVQIRDRDRINWCGEESELHPVAEAIAAEYDMPYEDVIGWFCSGAGMGEIELALRIGVATDSELETLFSLREEGMGWGQIMQDLDLIGGPAQQGPPDTAGPRDDDQTGAPDHAGPKEDQESGPPDQAGPRSDEAVGPKENLETGPPDNAGPKEESPSNQPDTVGPPDDLETGPPDNAGPKDEAPGQSETQPGNGNGRDNNDK